MKSFLRKYQYKVGARWLGRTYYKWYSAVTSVDAISMAKAEWNSYVNKPSAYWVEDLSPL